MKQPQHFKRCNKCGETKPVDEFYREKRPGGVYIRSRCISCYKAEGNKQYSSAKAQMFGSFLGKLKGKVVEELELN